MPKLMDVRRAGRFPIEKSCNTYLEQALDDMETGTACSSSSAELLRHWSHVTDFFAGQIANHLGLTECCGLIYDINAS